MSSYGFPSELDYSVLKSMYPAIKQKYVKQPINGSSFTSGDIQLILQKMERTFYDPNTLAVVFTATYAGATAGTIGTDGNFVLGSAYSHFSRQVVKALSGAVLETIDNPSLAFNTILNVTTNSSDKMALSTNMGFYAGNTAQATVTGQGLTNMGAYISNANNLRTQSFAIPLIGVLNAMKLIPAFCSDIEIDLTINSLTNIILTTTGLANSDVTSFTISNVSIQCESLTLEPSSFAQLMRDYPNVLKLKSSSLLYGSATLPAQSGAGTYDLTYSHNLSSLKQFLWWSSPANAAEKQYAGVCPNLARNGWQLLIGSTAYPQIPINGDAPAEQFYENLKSFGSLYSSSHSGSSNRLSFARASTANGEYLDYVTTMNTISLASSIVANNKWYALVDLETINNSKDNLFTGISTKGFANTLRLNVARQLANSVHTINFFSIYDVLIEFDVANQTISVIQ